MKRVFNITNDQSKFHALNAIKTMGADKPMTVTIQPETRTLKNNAAQWPILNAIAEQVMWPIDGAMTRISGEEFKQILTAAYRQEKVRVAQGVDGGMVLLGHRTREFKRAEWGEWMEFIQWFAAEKGVKIPMNKNEAARYD